MNRIFLPLLMVLALITPLPCLGQTPREAVELNNEAVTAMNGKNWQVAIDKLTAALRIEPTYSLARENLATAHYYYGLGLKSSSKEALKQFHLAVLLDDVRWDARQAVEDTIRKMG